MTTPPPLTGIRVLEFAGLAPGPFAGLLLADYGATVLRVDRATTTVQSTGLPPPTADLLTRHKSSIAVNFKSLKGLALIKDLVKHVDVVIDPFRPGVLEKLGLGPEEVLMKLNPQLVVGRMTGFRREGKYSQMAGHDINYIAVSGVLSMLGRAHEKPLPPGNILGDFAGVGSGKGQVVEANMVDGSAFLATMPRLAMNSKTWNRPRGENLLDGGCPYYDTYETKDGEFMAVGALEPQFFAALLQGLSIAPSSLPGRREDRTTWPALRELLTQTFLSKTRKQWECIFDRTDACVTPVLSQPELERTGFLQRPAVTLKSTPGFGIAKGRADRRVPAEGQGCGVKGEGWEGQALAPGEGGEEVLSQWLGWRKGKDFDIQDGGLVRKESLVEKVLARL